MANKLLNMMRVFFSSLCFFVSYQTQGQIYIKSNGYLGLGIETDIAYAGSFSNSVGINLMYTPDVNKKQVRNFITFSAGYKYLRHDPKQEGLYLSAGYQYYFIQQPKNVYSCLGTYISVYAFDLMDRREAGVKLGLVSFSTLTMYYQIAHFQTNLAKNQQHIYHGIGINITLNTCSIAHLKMV